MQDIIYVGLTVVFFLICSAYVRGLDRLVRGGAEGGRANDLAESTGEADGQLAEVRP